MESHFGREGGPPELLHSLERPLGRCLEIVVITKGVFDENEVDFHPRNLLLPHGRGLAVVALRRERTALPTEYASHDLAEGGSLDPFTSPLEFSVEQLGRVLEIRDLLGRRCDPCRSILVLLGPCMGLRGDLLDDGVTAGGRLLHPFGLLGTGPRLRQKRRVGEFPRQSGHDAQVLDLVLNFAPTFVLQRESRRVTESFPAPALPSRRVARGAGLRARPEPRSSRRRPDPPAAGRTPLSRYRRVSALRSRGRWGSARGASPTPRSVSRGRPVRSGAKRSRPPARRLSPRAVRTSFRRTDPPLGW